ncbi:MAG: DUF6075 family protein [Clostridiales bacterium]|nr:DUF6075 family protein [Clostridiales bacterium]MCD7956899.1 DUF6075 family protein [Lachnospiraceae bacterium]
MYSTYDVANDAKNNEILFRDAEHELFCLRALEKCRWCDVYHEALVYCLGIDRTTREHIDRIYDFKTGNVKPKCLNEGWQTSGSRRVVRMAFNLYCDSTPSVHGMEKSEDKLRECGEYSVSDLFCCSYARYFWEAIKIRYPEYCG